MPVVLDVFELVFCRPIRCSEAVLRRVGAPYAIGATRLDPTGVLEHAGCCQCRDDAALFDQSGSRVRHYEDTPRCLLPDVNIELGFLRRWHILSVRPDRPARMTHQVCPEEVVPQYTEHGPRIVRPVGLSHQGVKTVADIDGDWIIGQGSRVVIRCYRRPRWPRAAKRGRHCIFAHLADDDLPLIAAGIKVSGLGKAEVSLFADQAYAGLRVRFHNDLSNGGSGIENACDDVVLDAGLRVPQMHSQLVRALVIACTDAEFRRPPSGISST